MKFSDSVLCRIAAACCCNKPDDATDAIVAALDGGLPPRAIYEIILQSYLFGGFPAALEGMRIFDAILAGRGIPWKVEEKPIHNVDAFRDRGTELCKVIYGANYGKLISSAGAISPELAEWMILEGYGKTLSRGYVDSSTRELAITASLAALGWVRQLISHVRGAINTGATAEEVLEAIDIATPFAGDDVVARLKAQVLRHIPGMNPNG